MTLEQLIEQAAMYIRKYAPQYDIKVCSPILGQLILESGRGTSELAVNANNYLGLKYKVGRCPSAIGIYHKVGSEQDPNTGQYASSAMQWCKFANLEGCIKGYFEFISHSRYANLKGVTDPKKYLELIKADGYATSINYVANVWNVIQSYDLTRFDNVKKEEIEMVYTNSSLVTYTKISPNRTSPRNHKIDTITIHCYVGQVTAQRGCNGSGFVTYNPITGSSCNYVVGYDGSIGLCVPESDRSWCTSNSSNDHRAITIEVACETTHPYTVTDKAMAALINLCADICKRNDIEKLVWSTNKNERVNHLNGCNMTVHRDYKNKACPGQYLYERHGYIANEVNKKLGVVKEDVVVVPSETSTYKVEKYDTLSKIGKKTGIPWKTIANLNGIKAPYIVREGQVLKLTNTPTSTTTTTTSNNSSAKYIYNGLNYSLVFDPTYYANKYGDLKKAFGSNANSLWNHFKTYGLKEGRQGSANFNVIAYKNRYADLQKAFGNNLPEYYKHYVQFGNKEGRSAL